MTTKEIKKHNGLNFLIDIKRCARVVVYTQETTAYLPVTKKAVMRMASLCKVSYYVSERVHGGRRKVMIIL